MCAKAGRADVRRGFRGSRYGSGCGCSAITLCGYILQKMKKKEWKRVLFVPTGALLSTVSFNEGNSIPGIAHAVMLEGISGSGKGVGEWTM